MTQIEEILHSKAKPKEIQMKFVEELVSESIAMKDFISFFQSAKDKDKGTCADVLKHVSEQKPALLAPYIDVLIDYINYPSPRIKWGIPEAIGNLAKEFPNETKKAIPLLLKNTLIEDENTTVIKWCAAFALTEIAKNNPSTREQLLPAFDKILQSEQNNGVKNVYLKAIRSISKK